MMLVSYIHLLSAATTLQPTSVVYYPTPGALCIEYKNLDQAGVPYVSRAVLLDGESRISYSIGINDDLWIGKCGDFYSRSLVDLTDVAK